VTRKRFIVVTSRRIRFVVGWIPLCFWLVRKRQGYSKTDRTISRWADAWQAPGSHLKQRRYVEPEPRSHAFWGKQDGNPNWWRKKC
jgi:hypothetical protein